MTINSLDPHQGWCYFFASHLSSIKAHVRRLLYSTSVICLLGTPAYAQMKLPTPQMKTPERCSVPTELIRFSAATPHFAKTIKAGKNLKIIALGSSSTQGAGATHKNAPYPAILQAELRLKFPTHKVEVLNKGVGGDLTSDMLQRLDQDVLSETPTLVIWQTGVNDAMRKVDPDLFKSQLLTGIQKMRAHGIDIVMLDQQYSPATEKADQQNVYLDIVRQVSFKEHLPLLSRYQIMKHLVVSSQYSIHDLLSPDQFHMNDTSYKCLGLLLADALVHAAQLGTREEKTNNARKDDPKNMVY